jgi:hypothetical protein
VASHWGGTRNGTIVHWPNGIEDKGTTRNQFHHVIDVAPTILEANEPIPAGKHQVRMEFAYDGSGLAKGGDVTLYYDGTAVGTGRVEKNQPMGYSADEACDVGSDSSSPASPDYGPTGNRFTGEIEWVQLDIGEDSHDHLITAEERFNLAMARQ